MPPGTACTRRKLSPRPIRQQVRFPSVTESESTKQAGMGLADLCLALMAADLPDRADWKGLVASRAEPTAGPFIKVRVPTGARVSWSSPVRVTATDGYDYFAKFPEKCTVKDPKGGMSVAVEMVAAELGRLIKAPVCDTELLRVPDELLDDTALLDGVTVTSTVVHGSRALANAAEKKPRLPGRLRDNNRRRHVGVYAMWDWFVGSDPQWLVDLNTDWAIYSHDHGMYLPPPNTGEWLHRAGHWTEQELQDWVRLPHRLSDDPEAHADPEALSADAITKTAALLRAVDRAALQRVLNRVPASWPVDNEDLEGLGWFLESRAPAVAGRIESLSI